jgi:DNA-binding NarL/FixJ family response regulator
VSLGSSRSRGFSKLTRRRLYGSIKTEVYASHVPGRHATATKGKAAGVTTREQEILELIWAGFKNKEIGQRLKISVKTVEAHRSNMMKKMRVSNTAQLLRTAIDGSMIRIRVA